MNIRTTKDMTEYLRQIVALEGSIYRQQQALLSAEQNLKLHLPKKTILPVPVNKAKRITMADVEVMPEFKTGGSQMLYVWLGLSIFCVLSGLMASVSWVFWIGLIGTVMSLIYIVGDKREDASRKERRLIYFVNAQEEYEREQARYSKEMEAYKTQTQAINLEYEKNCAELRQAYSVAEKAVDKLKEPLKESEKLLQQLYDLNLIFPKYRYLVAMCTIYEYYASGRCSVLEGAEGAYNLYEAELRQNLVINQLEGISNKLDQIQKNQYALYSEIHNVRNVMEGIASDINSILKTTQSIAESSYITALNTKAIAENTEAIKYISLINS